MPKDLAPDAATPSSDVSSSTQPEGETPSSPLPSGTLPTEAELRETDLNLDAVAPSHEDEARHGRIREEAYAAYKRRGELPGHEVEDWLEAEQAVDAELGRQRSAE
ncbi:DUF2934 domain-containing protein [Variovorax davisae]|uniref:DUF2934 domain-containing protein n=1 Tax=Variovorax davisae TaxID=3053515 RepID=UPI0033658592